MQRLQVEKGVQGRMAPAGLQGCDWGKAGGSLAACGDTARWRVE